DSRAARRRRTVPPSTSERPAGARSPGLTTPSSGYAVGRGGQRGQDDADEHSDDERPRLPRTERRLQVPIHRAHRLRHVLPRLRGGRGELIGAEHGGRRDQDAERQHCDNGACEDAAELRDELLVRMGAEEVAALEIRGYAFTGDGTFGGLLPNSTWPTTCGGPKGKRHSLELSGSRGLHPRGRGRSVVKSVAG